MDYSTQLIQTVGRETPRLLGLRNVSASRSAGKWSRTQILGHLVDSAINNYARFVVGQLQPDLTVGHYQQDDWVRIGRYQETPWEEVVSLWRQINLQLARVIESAPVDLRRSVRLKPKVNSGRGAELTTLDDLMRDYLDHMQHHLNQIFD